MIKQICPLLLPVTDQDLKDYNSEARKFIDELLQQEVQSLKYAHSQLGLSFNMCPIKPAFLDKSGTIEMNDSQRNSELTAQAEIRTVSDALKQMFISKDVLEQIQKSTTPDVF